MLKAAVRNGSRYTLLLRHPLLEPMTANPPTSTIVRFLVPSVRDLVFIFLFWSILAGPLSNRPLADTDIGWHIRTGELILASHNLPRTDPFSSTMQGQTWFAWEWLYDVLLGALHAAGGLNGVVWLCALVIAFVFSFLLWQLLERGTGLALAVILMLLSTAVSAIHLFARPHIASWIFTLLWFTQLEKWEQWDRSTQGRLPRWISWFFPVSMVLWVNVHGGWLLGMSLLCIYALAALIESLRNKDAFQKIRAARRARAMALAATASALATLVNPFGWRLHAHIYSYLTDRYLINRIDEFRSPNFHGWAERAFVIILVLLLVALTSGESRTSGGQLRPSNLFVVLLCVYAGFISARNLPISAMLLAIIAGPMLWRSLVSLANSAGAWRWLRSLSSRIVNSSDRLGALELQLGGHVWPVVAVLFGLILILNAGWLGKTRLVHADFDPNKVPVEAVNFLQNHSEGIHDNAEPVFSIDGWGGYLIYRLYPQRKVVMDDRHDLYGSDRVREYLIFMQGESGWRDILRKWNFQTAILPSDSASANLLRELPQEWKTVYEDKVAVVLVRR